MAAQNGTNIDNMEIWKARNKAYFENVEMRCASIIEHIRSKINDHFVAYGVAKPQGKTSTEFLQFLGLKASALQVKFVLVRWIPLVDSWIKLNSDGASKVSPGMAGVRGVLRNSNTFIQGYAFFIDIKSSVFAEAMAFLVGIQHASKISTTNLWIELDSLLLV